MPARLAIVALLVATTAAAQSAKDELEQQLKDLVGKPPTKLLIEYEGLDQPNYKLAEVTFDLDGSSLPVPELEKLNGDGKHLVFHGDIKPGKHTLETTVVLTDVAGALFSYEAGYRWKVKNTRSFEQAPGLEVQVVIVPELNQAEKDPKKKFQLKSTAVPKMLAKLEDGSMPDAPKPNIAPSAEVDAGTAVAEMTPAEKAKLAKQAAAEEAKRKKEEAAAAKAAAAEEKKRLRDEAVAAKKAAAEDKKRQREEALAAKKAAAEEKKRQRDEALAAKSAPPPKEPTGSTGGTGSTGTGAPAPTEPTPTPTEPAAAEVADAGTAVAVAEQPKPAPKPEAEPPPSGGEGGFGVPLPVILGIGIAVLGLIIFMVTRRKRSPPQF